VVSIAETELESLSHFRDPDNSTSGASGPYFSPWTCPGGYNAQGGRDIQECHQRDHIWNEFPTGVAVALRQYESNPQGSEHM